MCQSCLVILDRSGSIEWARSEQSKTSSVRQHAARVSLIHSNTIIAVILL